MGRRPDAVAADEASARTLRTVRLVNPLPSALGHYEHALRSTLLGAGVFAEQAAFPSIERAGGRRLVSAVRVTTARQRLGSTRETTIVLWPAFGLAEPACWRSGPTWLVVHDPRPLRPQVGYGRIAAWVGAHRSHRLGGVIVHSSTAADSLVAQGWPAPTILPHPALDLTDSAPLARRDVAVLGQYKVSRDLQPLLQLGEDDALDLSLTIAGRGWPQVPGWTVESRFMPEAELDARLSSAAVVVIPYRWYFASGIAVRALERLAPVVALEHPALVDLLGGDWPGFVTDDDWPAAVRRAAAVPAATMRVLLADYLRRSQAAWSDFASALPLGSSA